MREEIIRVEMYTVISEEDGRSTTVTGAAVPGSVPLDKDEERGSEGVRGKLGTRSGTARRNTNPRRRAGGGTARGDVTYCRKSKLSECRAA